MLYVSRWKVFVIKNEKNNPVIALYQFTYKKTKFIKCCASHKKYHIMKCCLYVTETKIMLQTVEF